MAWRTKIGLIKLKLDLYSGWNQARKKKVFWCLCFRRKHKRGKKIIFFSLWINIATANKDPLRAQWGPFYYTPGIVYNLPNQIFSALFLEGDFLLFCVRLQEKQLCLDWIPNWKNPYLYRSNSADVTLDSSTQS